jgi:hypothetical protein
MTDTDKSIILKREPEHVKFGQLLKKAKREGRVDGDEQCPVCGMKFNSPDDAADCCRVELLE